MASSGKARAGKTKSGDKASEATASESIVVEGSSAAEIAGGSEALASDHAKDQEFNQGSDGADIPTEFIAPAAIGTRSGMKILGPLLGGLIAGGIGFLVAQYLGNDRWPFGDEQSVTDELAVAISGQDEALQDQGRALELLTTQANQSAEQLNNQPGAAAFDAMAAGLQAANLRGDESAAMLKGLEQRLIDLENRPIPDVGATQEAVELYSTELAAMRQMFEAELENIQATQAAAMEQNLDASEIAVAGLIRSAVSELRNASQNGQPFEQPLLVLADSGLAVPDILQNASKEGLASLADLTRMFPAAARSALEVAAQETDASGGGGVMAFVRNQLGVRSLKPREGEGVDAILSRAEAAVQADDISKAVAELETLSGPALGKMQEWIEKARLREQALTEILMLAASVEK